MTVREKPLKRLRGLADSPLGNADLNHVCVAGGRVAMRQIPSRSAAIAAAIHRAAGKRRRHLPITIDKVLG